MARKKLDERKTEKIFMRLTPQTKKKLTQFMHEVNKLKAQKPDWKGEKYTYEDFIKDALKCLEEKMDKTKLPGQAF